MICRKNHMNRLICFCKSQNLTTWILFVVRILFDYFDSVKYFINLTERDISYKHSPKSMNSVYTIILFEAFHPIHLMIYNNINFNHLKIKIP
jgi:hypothetical protein